MANPTLKNGYISIATELVEKLATVAIPSSEMRLVWIVWRKTWGWKDGDRHKDWDWIALSQFSKLSTIKRGNIPKLLKSLVYKRILLKGEKGYRFNQNYEEWGVYKRIPQYTNALQGGIQTHTKKVIQTHTHNRKKETITKETSKVGTLHGEEWNILIDSFKDINPMYLGFYKNTTERNALEDLAKVMGFEKLHNSIIALPKIINKPYAPKITKPTELKRDFGKLIAFYNQEKSKLNSKKIEIII